MGTIQDPFDNEDFISENLGNETDGQLRNIDLDEGTVLDFNGTSQYVTVTDHADFDITGDITLMAWVKIDSDASIEQFVVGKYAGGAARSYKIYITYGQLGCRLTSDGSTHQTFLSSFFLTTGKWYFVAATRASGVVTIFCDGKSEVSGTTMTGSIYSSATAVSVGAMANATNFLGGLIDDPRIYAEELSADTIFALAAAGIEPSATNLKGHWKFNDGSGVTATDSSAGSHDGDLTGHAPTWTTTHKPFYTTRARTTSTDLISSAISVDTFKYTGYQKSGATDGRFQFSGDGTTWKNSNGDSVTNAAASTFDGINDYADKQINNFRSGDTAGAITAWVYPTATTGRMVFTSTDGSVTDFLSLQMHTNNVIRLWMRIAGVHYRIGSLFTIPMNRWSFIAISSNGSTNSIWINGVSVPTVDIEPNTGKWFSALPTQRTNIAVGARDGSAGTYDNFFFGNIDDVRIHSSEPTAAQMWDLFARHKPTGLEVNKWSFDVDYTDDVGSDDLTASGTSRITNWEQVPNFGEGDTERTYVRSFDGTNDTANVATNNFRSGDGVGTISAWIKHQIDGVTVTTIFSSSDTATNNFSLDVSLGLLGEVRFWSRISGVSNIILSDGIVPKNVWTHIAVTCDGSTWKLWINGIEQGVTATVGSNTGDWFDGSPTQRDNVSIGVRVRASTGTYFRGEIGMVAYRSDEMTKAELITETENGYADIGDANLRHLWKCNEASSDIVDSIVGLDLTTSGVTSPKDIHAPADAPPTQQSIDISGLGYTNDFYYRFLLDSGNPQMVYSLDESTVSVTLIVTTSKSIPVEISVDIPSIVAVREMPVEMLATIQESSAVPVELLIATLVEQGIPVEVAQPLIIVLSKEMPIEVTQLDRVFYGSGIWTFVIRGATWTQEVRVTAWTQAARETIWTQVEGGTDWTLINEDTTWTFPE